ncbi:MAG: right-handed parallel beta-helix repeat-containing protein [Ginsengibacter sp.]
MKKKEILKEPLPDSIRSRRLGIFISLFVIFSASLFFSCKKDSYITSPDASLYTSADTLSFDTVFTSVGSVTQSFKIFNNNNQKLRLSRVALSGGLSSPFKINIDGTSAPEADNIEINPNDSMYIFVQVNGNPNGATLPFILSDSIRIDYNGNKKFVQLQAYGQNAVFLKKAQLTGNVTWDKTLPYVIIGGIQIDAGSTLTISAGTKIFLHADAPFLVDGTLKINGTKEGPVIFTGDRMDEDYKDLPASWPGIYFRGTSENNTLKHTIIKNAYRGIIVQDLSSTPNPKLNLSQCIIDNIYDAGITGINTNIYADNCLISNCGSNLSLAMGGDYRFINCTVASYNNTYITHKNPVLQLSDSYIEGATVYYAALNALFQNCIFWGDGGTVDDEITTNKQGPNAFSVSFDHVLYKAKNDISNATFISSIKNEQPMFDSIDASRNIYDFHFNNHPNSPAVNAGVVTPFLYDLEDKLRGATPDIGCYQR